MFAFLSSNQKFAMATSSRATFMVESFFTMLPRVQKDVCLGHDNRSRARVCRESDNPTHCYAVVMKKGNKTVGHAPRAMSKMVHAQCVCICEHVHMWYSSKLH